LAIGSPFGLNHSVTSGIISGKGRRDLELGNNGVRYQDFLQTDAAINPGNSGGPLINTHGEVIGINTAIASNSGGSDGIGFTIPINSAMRVARELVEFGYVRRGFLGVSLDARYNRDAARAMGLQTAFGARVSAITPDSPAARTDLMVGDVILTFGGRVVENDSHLVSQVSQTQVGQTVEMEVFRQGQRTKVSAVIRDREDYQVSK
jgi:serine protease Do